MRGRSFGEYGFSLGSIAKDSEEVGFFISYRELLTILRELRREVEGLYAVLE